MTLEYLKEALKRVPSYGTIPTKDDPVADEEGAEGHDVPVDGGLAAWLTVFGAFLALFCSFGQMNAFGTFQSWYTTHQLRDLHPSTIAWIGSVQLWVFFFSGGFIGRMFDAHGPRVIMALGTVIYVVSIALTSMARGYHEYIIAQGVLSGLGIGMLFYPPLASISTHFSKYRATALGIAMVGSGIGGTIYPILLQYLFATVGFAWGVRVSAILCLVLSVTATATVSRRTTHSIPDTGSKKTDDVSWPLTSIRALQDPPFALLVVGSCFMALGLFTPFTFIVSYASDQGISPDTAFYVLAVLNAGSVLGRIAPPRYADTSGRFALLVPCAALAGLSTLLLWPMAHSLVPLVVYAALYGLFSGAFNALIVPCIAQISDIREIGMRIGLLYSIISFPSLVGNPAAGALLRVTHGSYSGLIVLSGTSVIVGSLFILMAKLRIDSNVFARV
ncbi:MFS general substrate transporter [Lentinus tigrinus ALCF2SS1-7]|uniref:MFS general substrate transporter n=1 Tax=Lentinus tigrinus ALCF2SS1-7 TaxID=1328758 RepID=UPI001165CA91|nr:MFS general substrate transporter [Lentinus tigrinus ALCF2SS1-7]